MITSLNEFKKIYESKNNNGTDLVIVDVQEEYKKFFGEAYLEALEEYCEDFNRVFQIYDSTNVDYADYTFPNQSLTIEKQYGRKLSIEDVPYYFSEPMRDTILKKFEYGFYERDLLETIKGDYFVYIDGQHEWFYCSSELANLFKKFVAQSRKIILVGGAAEECLKDIYVTMKAFGVNVEYNLDLVYSATGSKYQQYVSESVINENNRASLYHGLKIKYAINAINNNKLDAYTFQRYWADGKRYKDDEPEYLKSYYYRGLSLTRDIKYAANWNSIIFEFDQNILKNKYKLVPYNWGYSIGNGYEQKEKVKNEREEFLIVSYVKKVLTNQQLIKMLETPGGAIEPLNKFLSGIYIRKTSYDIYTDNDTKIYKPFEILKKHPLYKGLL